MTWAATSAIRRVLHDGYPTFGGHTPRPAHENPGRRSWPQPSAPARVETQEGRAEYRRRQRELAERAQPLRARLIEALENLLEDRED